MASYVSEIPGATDGYFGCWENLLQETIAAIARATAEKSQAPEKAA